MFKPEPRQLYRFEGGRYPCAAVCVAVHEDHASYLGLKEKFGEWRFVPLDYPLQELSPALGYPGVTPVEGEVLPDDISLNTSLGSVDRHSGRPMAWDAQNTRWVFADNGEVGDNSKGTDVWQPCYVENTRLLDWLAARQ